MKVVLLKGNDFYDGGFPISDFGFNAFMKEIGLLKSALDIWDIRYEGCLQRDSKALVDIAEKYGDDIVDQGHVKVVEIPDGINWDIGLTTDQEEFVFKKDELTVWF